MWYVGLNIVNEFCICKIKKAYNIQSEPSIILSNPDGENSLFGYSYSANSNSVLVGAPLHSGGTGSLFECTLDTEQCRPIISNDVASGSEHFFHLV